MLSTHKDAIKNSVCVIQIQIEQNDNLKIITLELQGKRCRLRHLIKNVGSLFKKISSADRENNW